MHEHPIIFSAPMVRAILEGRKTQTRRVVKLPHANPLGQWEPTTFGGGGIYTTKGEKVPHQGAIWHTRTGDVIGCPYGQPGDRLWVRETWGCKDADRPGVRDGRKPQPGDSIQYAANDADAWQWRVPGALPWRPSIHMPRWASRITLEITDVRVQRVQDISEEDALAEGCRSQIKHSAAFADLWDSINESRGFGWNANPYVWALTFRRVEQSQ